MKWIIPVFFLILAFSNCKVLSSSQRESISDFAAMAGTVAEVPTDIYSKYYALNHEYKMLNSAADFLDAPKIEDAIANLEEKQQDIATDNKMILQFKTQYGILKQFAELLAALADDHLVSTCRQARYIHGITGLHAAERCCHLAVHR